jgi:hypothetical protein
MHKILRQVAGEWVPHSYPPEYSLLSKDSAHPKIVAGVPAGDPMLFTHLVECLEPPYFLLYVLHTPRGEAAAGRYQSPPLSVEQYREFAKTFGSYLSADARFDIWAHASAEQATLVWDRHNQLFAYGPIEKFLAVLLAYGFSEGTVDISFPHLHHYRPECDVQAASVIDAFDWSYSPLRKEDEQ